MKFGASNIFKSVCHSLCPQVGGGGVSQHAMGRGFLPVGPGPGVSVCGSSGVSVSGSGVCTSPGQIPPRQTPTGQTPPLQADTPPGQTPTPRDDH